MSNAGENAVSAKELELKQSSARGEKDTPPDRPSPAKVARAPAIIVTIIICAVVGTVAVVPRAAAAPYHSRRS